MNNRNLTLEAFRGLFILYMIIHHFDYYFMDQIPHFTEAMKKLFYEGFVGVNFFFMLSGFGCVMGYKKRLVSGEITQLQFLKNRIFNLWPTYLLLLIAAVFIYNLKFTSIHFFEHVFMIQAWMVSGKSVFCYNAAAWCVSACMFFYVVYCFIYKMNFKISLAVSCLFSLYILINILSYGSYTGSLPYLFYTNPLFRCLEFVVGMTIALYIQEYKTFASVKLQWISIFVMIGAIFIGTYSGIPLYWRWSLYYLLPCALLILAFSGETSFSQKLFNHKWLQEIAKISMVIYLVHQEIINGLKLWLPESIKLLYFKYFIPFGAIGVILLSIFVSFIIHKFYTKPISNLLKNMKFNRR